MEKIIQLDRHNIDKEHICCAIADKKCKDSYELKKESVKKDNLENQQGIVVYYSNRCPFSEYHVTTSLKETAEKRNLPLKLIKLETMEQAQAAPTPATIFSLFYNGKFISTDLSVCMDSRFDKVVFNS